ncbi:MAG: phage tail assembly chaperone [Pseudomonadota bacterium]
MALFFGERAMAPAQFWALTIPEIAAVIGRGRGPGPLRADLAQLMETFPDD